MDKSKNRNYEILDKILFDIPPLRNEHNQAEIDAEQARILRESAAQRKTVEDIERYLRS